MTTNLIVPDPGSDVAIAARGREALTRLAPRYAVLDPKKFSAMNFDPNLGVSRALGVAPAVTAMRDRIRQDCTLVDQVAIDELEDRAYAAATANGDYEAALNPPQGFNAVVNEVFEARAVLLAIVRSLIACNLMKEEQIAKINGGHGHREAAGDILTIVGGLTRDWQRLDGKMPVSRDQLQRLAGLAEKLLQLLGIRDQIPERAAAAADVRIRAFTLLDEAYDAVRRAVTYLRWDEDDADAIAPPLRSRPVNRKPAEKDDTVPATAMPADKKKDEPAIPLMERLGNAAVAVPAAPAPSGLPRSNPYGRE